MIRKPSCYGKIPVLGDYIQINVPHEEMSTWWNRFAAIQEWNLRASPGALPWCFVLTPEMFSWSTKLFVVGAFCLSEDNIGRRYPLVAWQKISFRALRHTCLFGTDAPPQNWLFWLSRLLLSMTPGCSTVPEPAVHAETRLNQLWELYRLDWRARLPCLNWHRELPAESALRNIIGALPDSDIQGVPFMPWADWPDILWKTSPSCFFWQQDHEGGYTRFFRERNFSQHVVPALFPQK